MDLSAAAEAVVANHFRSSKRGRVEFGVSDFWSYFFPFDEVTWEFEGALDAWVRGEARIAVHRGKSRKLQVLEGAEWTTIYGANGCLLPLARKPVRYEFNDLSPRNSDT